METVMKSNMERNRWCDASINNAQIERTQRKADRDEHNSSETMANRVRKQILEYSAMNEVCSSGGGEMQWGRGGEELNVTAHERV